MIHAKVLGALLTIALVLLREMATQKKKANYHLKVNMIIALALTDLRVCKGLMPLPGSMDHTLRTAALRHGLGQGHLLNKSLITLLSL